MNASQRRRLDRIEGRLGETGKRESSGDDPTGWGDECERLRNIPYGGRTADETARLHAMLDYASEWLVHVAEHPDRLPPEDHPGSPENWPTATDANLAAYRIRHGKTWA